MVILMKQDKSLVKTVNSRLYQGENVVDTITIYVPAQYEDNDLSEFIASIYYSNSVNLAYAEVLDQLESDKEGFLMYKLPVTTKFTSAAGEVTFYLSFTKNDEETNTKYVLHSSEMTIQVDAWNDYFKYIDDASLSAIDNKLLELDTEIDKLKSVEEALDKTIPNDLKITEDVLQLSKDGEPIGDGVEIYVAGDQDDEDEDHDGVIDIDDLKEDSEDNASASASNGLTFIEL